MSPATESRIAELQARIRTTAAAKAPVLRDVGTEPRKNDRVRKADGTRAGVVTDASGFTVTISTTAGALIVESVGAFRAGTWRVEA